MMERIKGLVCLGCAVAVFFGMGVQRGWCAEAGGPPGPRYYHRVERGQATLIACDVAVYGGTPGGVTAAIEAARMGKKTVLLSVNRHVGGLTSGGLTATDTGDATTIGGMAREFYDRLGIIRDFRPSEAEALFRKMLEEAGVSVLLERCLESVTTEGGRLTSATMETGETVEAAVFIDATYEGDLMAAAGVSYRVGREPASAYGESLAGQWQGVSWTDVYQFCRLPLSPYVEPGNPESGLLPEVASEPPGEPGEGDHKVQAYNFRMFLTDQDGKVPFPKPRGYDPGRYALLARFLNFDPDIEWKLNYTTEPMTDGPVQMRNGDCNNAGSFSSDYVGGNYRWPDGVYESGSFSELPPPRRGLQMPFRELYELRERIFQDHVSYQQGLMYFLAHDPQVPDALQERVNRFGLDPREFQDTAHWPHQLYVREGRRMVSDYVMTQANCESKRTADDSIGLASYPMDSHFCQRVVVEENGKTTVRNEGGFGHRCPGPYPVSYRAIVPKREECTNLLVPVCLSASHAAYGSIRMEPVFMILGQSAGAAAALAIDGGIGVQDVAYDNLRKRLEEVGQRLGPLAHAGLGDAREAAPVAVQNGPSGEYYDWTKTKTPERPYIHDYSQTLVVKLFLAEKAPDEGCKVYLTFEQALDVIRKLDNITCGIPKIAYLVGWQFNGHDSKYPSWAEVNARLKRPEDATARESLHWLMAEGRKYHTTVSLHINMFDAYEDSPLWQEYLEKDVIAKDVDGHPLKGEVFGSTPRADTQSYQISYAREWELGLAQNRIDGLLAMLPIGKAGTIHIDAFHSLTPVPHAYPQEKYPDRNKEDKRISPYLDYSLEREVAAQRKIIRYFRDKGVDVTSEGTNFLRPDAFIGLQPMAWHYNAPAHGIPASLYCGTPMQAEQEIKKDPENLTGLLDQFCLRALPWYYANNTTAEKGSQQTRQGDDVCMPALWKEDDRIIAYSRNGYENETWQLPPEWRHIRRAGVFRVTLNGPVNVGEVRTRRQRLTLSLGKGEAVEIVPER